MSGPLKAFVRQILESEGALVEESGPELIGTLVPPDLARRLGCPSFAEISFSADLSAGAQAGQRSEEHLLLTYGSPLLDRLLALAREQGHLARFSLEQVYLKRDGIDQEVRKRFSFQNCRAQPGVIRENCNSYIVFNMKYVAISDERIEGLIAVPVNRSSLAVLPGFLAAIHRQLLEKSDLVPQENLSGRPVDDVYRAACEYAGQCVRDRLQEFERSMKRRLGRDVSRLEEYYTDIIREILARIARRGLSGEEKEGELVKASAAEQELKRKLEDLRVKYSISVKVALVNACRIDLPVILAPYLLERRDKQREVTIFWNPVLKAVEPVACEGCLHPTTSIFLCDERLHLVCASCYFTCSGCRRRTCLRCFAGGCPTCGSK